MSQKMIPIVDDETDNCLRRLQGIIASRTGVQMTACTGGQLHKTLSERMRERRLSSLDEYSRFLLGNTAESRDEEQKLTIDLTTSETYFFRDKGQFALLQGCLLPELIKRKREEKSLRIWSAACATGEEVYSVAILVDNLLPEREHWHVGIWGTDINSASLDKARRGIYTRRSFRSANPEIERRYFLRRGEERVLDERIRDMVNFQMMDLREDPALCAGMGMVDLILCRNVLIYLTPSAVAGIVKNLTDKLCENGYLMTGHCELHGLPLPGLRPCVFPESVVYQRVHESPVLGLPASSKSVSGKFIGEMADIVKEEGALIDMGRTAEMFRNRAGALTISDMEHVADMEPYNFDSCYHLARTHANRGDYATAAAMCRRAMKFDALAPGPYYLLAQVAQAERRFCEAGDNLRKVIYLNPGFAPAFIELAYLYERDGDVVRAGKMRLAALDILRALPPDRIVDPYGIEARQVMEHIRKILD